MFLLIFIGGIVALILSGSLFWGLMGFIWWFFEDYLEW